MHSTPSPRARVAAALALQDASTAVLLSAAQPSDTEIARLQRNAQQAAYETTKRQAHYAANPDYDPALLKPVRLVAPPQGLHPAERARLSSELISLKRERDTTQEAIDYILEQLAA